MSKEEIKEGMENVTGGVKSEPENESRGMRLKLVYGGPCIGVPKFPAVKYGGPCVGIPKLPIKPLVKPKDQHEHSDEPLTAKQPINPEK